MTLTAKQLAARWHCSARTIVRMIKRRSLSATRIGKKWLIRLATIEQYERNHTV